MLAKVEKFIQQNRLLEQGDRVVVAVSGGVDSVVLLHVLIHLAPLYQLNLVVAHLDHGLRTTSARDADFVQRLCEKLAIEAVEIEYVNVKNLQIEQKLGLEEAARIVRYEFLERIAEKYQCNKIALGQHMQDQAETVLLNLFRGSGTSGLKGILPLRNKLIRPLLSIAKLEIIAFAKEKQLSFVEDESNFLPDCRRNKIRLELMPELEQEYNPKITECLANLASLCADEDVYFRLAEDDFIKKEVQQFSTELILKKVALFGEHKALQRRILRRIYQLCCGTTSSLAFVYVEQILDFWQNTQSSLRLPGEVLLKKRGEKIAWLYPERLTKALPFQPQTILEIENRIIKLEGTFSLELRKKEEVLMIEAILGLPCASFLAVEKLEMPLILRTAQVGDIFTTSQGSRKKIMGLYQKTKIPLAFRSALPVLEDSSGEIIWVAGIGTGKKVLCDANTRIFLQIHLRKNS